MVLKRIIAICYSIAAFACMLVFVLAVSVAAAVVKILLPFEADMALFNAGVNIAVGVLGTIIAVPVYKKIKSSADSFGKYTSNIYDYISLFIMGIVVQIMVFCILNLLYIWFGDKEIFKSYQNISDSLNGSRTTIILVYTMFLAPICEEFFFRGIIMRLAGKGFGLMGANIVQALLFGVYHGNIIQGIYAFVAGMILGYVAGTRKSLSGAVFLHLSVNIAGILVAPLLLDVLVAYFAENIIYYVGGAVAAILVVVWIIFDNRKINKKIGDTV